MRLELLMTLGSFVHVEDLARPETEGYFSFDLDELNRYITVISYRASKSCQ